MSVYCPDEQPTAVEASHLRAVVDALLVNAGDPLAIGHFAGIVKRLEQGATITGLAGGSEESTTTTVFQVAQLLADTDTSDPAATRAGLYALTKVLEMSDDAVYSVNPPTRTASVPAGRRYPHKRVAWYQRGAVVSVLVAGALVAIGSAGVVAVNSQEEIATKDAEIATLQERLGAVANEKAQEQDAKASAETAARHLVELTSIALEVNSEFESCLSYSDEWADVLSKIALGYAYNRSSLDSFISEMARVCGGAKGRAKVLRDYISSLE